MTPIVSIIMGSTSDLKVMEAAAKHLDAMEIPYEILALSAHRTPALVEQFARGAAERGVKVIIAGAGGAAHVAGVTAAMTTVPVIGVPIKTSALGGLDSLLSIVQMPGGIPVATTAINGAKNAALIAAQIFALTDKAIEEKLIAFREKQTAAVLAATLPELN